MINKLKSMNIMQRSSTASLRSASQLEIGAAAASNTPNAGGSGNATPGGSHSRERSRSVTSQKSKSDSLSSLSSLSKGVRRSRSKTPLIINTGADVTSFTAETLRTPSPIEPKKLNSLQHAVHKNDPKKVKSLLAEKKRDVNKSDTFHRFTALHLAAEENKLDIAELLLDPIAAISPTSISGPSDTDHHSLSFFKKTGAATAVDSAIATSPLKKCNVDCLNQEERTPLTLATIRGHSKMVQLLLDHGASPNIPDLLGCTPIHYAILLSQSECLNKLLEASPNMETADKSGLTYLQHSIRMHDLETAELLISKGAPVNQASKHDRSTALHLAVEINDESIVRLLLAKGADPNAEDINGKTPIRRVSQGPSFNQDMVDLLTVKILQSEARQSLGKKSFLEPASGVDEISAASSGKKSAVEETEIVAIDEPQTAGPRGRHDAARDLGIDYSSRGAVETGRSSVRKDKVKSSKMQHGQQPGDVDMFNSDSMDLSESEGGGGNSPLDLSEPSEISISEDDHGSDSAIWSALGLTKSDREEARRRKKKRSKKAISTKSISLGSIHEDNNGAETGVSEFDGKSATEVSEDREELDIEPEVLEMNHPVELAETTNRLDRPLSALRQAKKEDGKDDFGDDNESVSLTSESVAEGMGKTVVQKFDSSAASKSALSQDGPSESSPLFSMDETSSGSHNLSSQSANKDNVATGDLLGLAAASGLDKRNRRTFSDSDISDPESLQNDTVEHEKDEEEDDEDIQAKDVEKSLPLVLPPLPSKLPVRANSISLSSISVAQPISVDLNAIFAPLMEIASMNEVLMKLDDLKPFVDDSLSNFLAHIVRRAGQLENEAKASNLICDEVRAALGTGNDEIISDVKQQVANSISLQVELEALNTRMNAVMIEGETQRIRGDAMAARAAEAESSLASEVRKREDLERRLVACESDLATLSSRDRNTAELAQRLEAARAESEIRMNLLKVRVEEAESELQSAKGTIKTLEESLKVSNDAEIEAKSTITSTKASLTQEIEKRSALQREVKYLRQTLKGYGGSVESLAEDSQNDHEETPDAYQAYLTRLEEDLFALQKRLEQQSDGKALLEKQIEEARFHSEEVADELNELQKALTAEKRAVMANEERITIMTLEVENSTARIRRLEDSIKQRDDEKSALSENVRLEAEKVDKLQRNIFRMQAELEGLKEDKASDAAAIESRNNQIESLRAQIKDLVLKGQSSESGDEKSKIGEDVIQYYETEIKHLRVQFDEEKEARLTRETEIKKIAVSVVELEDRVIELKSLYDKQVQLTTEKEAVRQSLANELSISQSDAQNLRDKINDAEIQLARLRGRTKELEEELSKQSSNSEKDLSAKTDEIAALRQKNSSLEKSVRDLESQVETLKVSLETKSSNLTEVEKQTALFKSESHKIQKELNEFKSQTETQLEDMTSMANDRLKQLDRAKLAIKEKESRLAELENELTSVNTQFKEVQSNLEKKLRDSEHEKYAVQSECDDAKNEIHKLMSSLTQAKSRYIEIEAVLQEKITEQEDYKDKVSRMAKQLESERRKTDKLFKSQDNLRSRLSSRVDLSYPEGSDPNYSLHLAKGLSSEIQPSKLSLELSSDPFTNLRELQVFTDTELKSIDSRLSSLHEELGKDLARITGVMSEIELDAEVESGPVDLFDKFLQTQNGRITEARTIVQNMRASLAATSNELLSGFDGFKGSIERQLKRSKATSDELAQTNEELVTSIEELKRKKATIHQQLAESIAKIEILEDEKETWVRKVKDQTEVQRLVEEKNAALEENSKILEEMRRKLGVADAALKAKTLALESTEGVLSAEVEKREKAEIKLRQTEREASRREGIINEKDKFILELESNIKERQDEISSLQKRISNLKGDIKQKESQIELTVLESRDSLNAASQQVNQIRSSVEVYEKKIEELRQALRELQLQLSDEKTTNSKLRTELENSIQQKASYEVERVQLTQSLKSTKDLMDENQQRIFKLEKSLTQADVCTKDQDAIIKNLKADLEETLGSKQRLEQQLASTSMSRKEEITSDVWEAERKGLVDEINRKTQALAQAERDAIFMGRQLKDTTSRLQNLQVVSDSARDGVFPDDRVALLTKELQIERDGRREAEVRNDRVRRQLEEEIACLTSSRKRLEDREAFVDHQRRTWETKVFEMQEALEAERGIKHKLREELHTVSISLRTLEVDNSRLKRLLEGQEPPETTRLMKCRNVTLEEENSGLREKLHKLELNFGLVEARAKSNFDAKLRKIAMRLEDQSRERERVDQMRQESENEMRESYERKISSLKAELDTIGHLLVSGRARSPVSWRSRVQTGLNSKDNDLTQNLDSLKRSNKTLSRGVDGKSSAVKNEMRSRSKSPSPRRKLKFCDLVSRDSSDSGSSMRREEDLEQSETNQESIRARARRQGW